MNKDPKSILALILMCTVMPWSILTMIGLTFGPKQTQEEWEKDHPKTVFLAETFAKGAVLIHVGYDALEKGVEAKQAVDEKIDTIKDVKASLGNKIASVKELFVDETEPLGRFDARMVE